jgi:hypothetical protein
VAAVFTVVTLVTPAPLVLAQAPAPKVTITALFDQVTSAGRNFYDGNYACDNDREWYARREANDAYLVAARVRLAF